jgi:hypothetical protein
MGAAVARVCCVARAVELLRNTKRECERGFVGVQRNVPTIVHDRTVRTCSRAALEARRATLPPRVKSDGTLLLLAQMPDPLE